MKRFKSITIFWGLNAFSIPFRRLSFPRVWRIRDLNYLYCGIRENANFLKNTELDRPRGAVFAKILARDAVLGKKMVFGIEMTEFRNAGLS